jgi:hypothetical protein
MLAIIEEIVVVLAVALQPIIAAPSPQHRRKLLVNSENKPFIGDNFLLYRCQENINVIIEHSM